MRYCKNCGLLAPFDADRCPQCGTPLPPEPQAAPAPRTEARYTEEIHTRPEEPVPALSEVGHPGQPCCSLPSRWCRVHPLAGVEFRLRPISPAPRAAGPGLADPHPHRRRRGGAALAIGAGADLGGTADREHPLLLFCLLTARQGDSHESIRHHPQPQRRRLAAGFH